MGTNHLPTGEMLDPPEPFEGLDYGPAQVSCLGCDSFDFGSVSWELLLGIGVIVIVIVVLVWAWPWWVPATLAVAVVPGPSS